MKPRHVFHRLSAGFSATCRSFFDRIRRRSLRQAPPLLGSRMFIYAVLLDFIELSLLSYALLITAEAVLPGIISSRITLSGPLAFLLILIIATGLLGKSIGAIYPFAPDKKSPTTWVGIAWLAFLLTLSSVRFSPILVPFIVGLLFLTARLMWRLLFRPASS